MGEFSKIEWCDHTFNPWVGCTKISPGCDHCYAEGWAKRSGLVKWGELRRRTSEANWRQPLKWHAAVPDGQRARVFCASLADVFDTEVPDEWRYDLIKLIRQTPRLDWLLLTKRIGNAKRILMQYAMEGAYNIWLGATVVNQMEANRDIPKLLATPARVRFLSCEPLLGPIDIAQAVPCGYCCDDLIGHVDHPFITRGRRSPIHWVIAGGESGHHARPVHPDWIRSLRDQCLRADVAFYFKQWGEFGPEIVPPVRDSYRWPIEPNEPDSGIWSYLVGKKASGRLLDGRTWDEFPRSPA